MLLEYENSRLTKAVLPDEDYPGEELYSYNDRGRISRISWSYGEDGSGNQNYRYENGRLRKVTMNSYDLDYAFKDQWNFSYNERDLISKISEITKEQDNRPDKSVYEISRDENDRLLKIELRSSGEIREVCRFTYEESLLSTILVEGREDHFSMKFHYEKGRSHVGMREYILYLDPVIECIPDEAADGYTLMYMLFQY